MPFYRKVASLVVCLGAADAAVIQVMSQKHRLKVGLIGAREVVHVVLSHFPGEQQRSAKIEPV